MTHKLVYIAGPRSAKDVNKTISDICQDLGFDTYISKHENTAPVFCANLKALERAGFVVANLSQKDTTTSWELGYAVARGKPVLGFGTDRSWSSINIMIKESTFTVGSLDDLYDTIKALRDRLIFQEDSIKDRNTKSLKSGLLFPTEMPLYNFL